MTQYRWKSVAMAAACMLALSACAATRSEVTVPTQSAKQSDSGTAVVVLPPVDARKFEAAPTHPSTPSLKFAEQINDPAITSRAVGRKRNGFGMAWGDVLLNPPQTVSSLVSDAVKAGLRDAGYRVVEAGDPAAATAPRINVRIDEFWTWFGARLQGWIKFEMSGTPRAPAATATVEVREAGSVLTESQWVAFIDSLATKAREQVRTLAAPKTAALR